MFALDPPPLIALKPRLIACRVSTACLSLSYPSIAGGAAGLANPMVPWSSQHVVAPDRLQQRRYATVRRC